MGNNTILHFEAWNKINRGFYPSVVLKVEAGVTLAQNKRLNNDLDLKTIEAAYNTKQ